MKGIKILQTSQYDSSRCERYWENAGELWLIPIYFEDRHASWAWAVKEEDLEEFFKEYSDVDWKEVEVGKRFAYAVDFYDFDQWVTGKADWEDLPELKEFDPAQHTIEKEYDYEWPGPEYGNDNVIPILNSPWAILISPVPLTKDWKIREEVYANDCKKIKEEWRERVRSLSLQGESH